MTGLPNDEKLLHEIRAKFGITVADDSVLLIFKLIYGCESWTLYSTTENRIVTFEMYLYRRMLRVPWTRKVTNIEILARL